MQFGAIDDDARARAYLRLLTAEGHEVALSRTPIRELSPLRAALVRLDELWLLRLLDEGTLIDLASRDPQGRPTREYLEVEELAFERLDRELERELPRLEARFADRLEPAA